MSIEGIPDGWEPVRYDYPNKGESFLNGQGEIILHIYDTPSPRKRLIIRKIEKPKQYRPFNDPAEAEPFLGFPLRLKVDHQDKFVVIGITSHAVLIGLQCWSLQEAFDCFERLDGTPFGIEVTE